MWRSPQLNFGPHDFNRMAVLLFLALSASDIDQPLFTARSILNTLAMKNEMCSQARASRSQLYSQRSSHFEVESWSRGNAV